MMQLTLWGPPEPIINRITLAPITRKLNRYPWVKRLRWGQKQTLIAYLREGMQIEDVQINRDGSIIVSLQSRWSAKVTPLPNINLNDEAIWLDSQDREVVLLFWPREQTCKVLRDKIYHWGPFTPLCNN